MTAYVPISFPGVMISGTSTDLAHHRAALITALDRQGLKAIAMEHSSATAEHDLIDASLQMVRGFLRVLAGHRQALWAGSDLPAP